MTNGITAKHYLLSATLIREKLPKDQPYLKKLPIIKNLGTLEFHSSVTFIVGENGSGKSTLIEALAVGMGFNPEGGTKNFNFSTQSTHSGLFQALKLTKSATFPQDGFFLRAESFYNVATNIDELDKDPTAGSPIINSYGGVSLHHQSHGESFMALIENRFGGHGIYILDEPEAALSPSRLFQMLVRIHQLVQKNSQFIIATHSPILLAYPDAHIYQLTDGKLTLTPYEQTEHFQLTKGFLDNYQKVLSELLEQ